MRVLQVIDSLAAGGAENMAVRIANALVDEVEFSGLVVTRKGGPLQESLDSAVHYFELNRRSTFDISAVRKLREICKENCITTVHAHSSSVFIAALALLGIDGLKIVLHDHNSRLDERRVLLTRIAGKIADSVIAVSIDIADWNIRAGVSPEQISVIPNFIDINKNVEAPATDIPGVQGRRVVAVANIRPVKNHLRLIRAFREVVVEIPDAHLILVGSLADGEHTKSVQQLILSCDLGDSVSLLGTRTDVPEILAASDIGVLVSLAEGFPVALIEYGLAGLPVVTSAVGQISEVTNGGTLARLVAPEDEAAIASAILALLGTESGRELAESFQQSVLDRYTSKSVIPLLLEVYSEAGS